MKLFLFHIVFTLLNAYVTVRLLKDLPVYQNKTILIILIASLVLIQDIVYLPQVWLVKFENFVSSQRLTNIIYGASYLLFGIMSCLLFYVLVMDVVYIILKISLPHSSLYTFFDTHYVLIIVAFTMITTVLSIVTVIKGPIVERMEVAIKNLPAGFDNFKIVQISDLHVGKVIKHDYVQNVVNIANSLQPNIIALTGDFVDGLVPDLEHDVRPLNQLIASHGIFFITGNHEYYSGAEQWVQKFAQLGFKVLSNEHVIINQNHDQIILAGVNDYSTITNRLADPSDPAKAIAGAPHDLVKILLAHQPASYVAAHAAGYDLQLSGHTHGGQYFPFTLLIRFFHRYYKGLNNHAGMWIYINRGTGYWGPPLRLGAAPEITLIVLKCAQ